MVTKLNLTLLLKTSEITAIKSWVHMIIHKHLYPYNWHNSKLTLAYSVY